MNHELRNIINNYWPQPFCMTSSSTKYSLPFSHIDLVLPGTSNHVLLSEPQNFNFCLEYSQGSFLIITQICGQMSPPQRGLPHLLHQINFTLSFFLTIVIISCWLLTPSVLIKVKTPGRVLSVAFLIPCQWILSHKRISH